MVLEKINQPNDIKSLTDEELKILASEIREFLIEKISVTGGHLASNLGVVELTMALHLALDLPKDKIIWDVGHQSYTHKLLTGRREGFDGLRKYGGMSGFPKRKESECDCFDTGHSSTSISAGLGYALAREITGEDYKVVSVIGDGALTGGMAFEALNNAARLKSNFIIILNDNNMSISENVGGLSSYLAGFRTADAYLDLKLNVLNSLNKMPYGDKMVSKIRKTKSGIKQLLIPGMFFEEMGIVYLGPVDGGDLHGIVKLLREASHIDGPVLIHVMTHKGAGYAPAERHPARFHGTEPFDIETGLPKNPRVKANYTDIFSTVMRKLGDRDEKVVAITAAMADGTGLKRFRNMFPERFFDVGIAEGHSVTFSAGLAKEGMIPFCNVYSSFMQRAYDMVIHDVALQKLHMVICLDRAGLVGEDGATHHGVFDLAYLRPIPNLVIASPLNELDLRNLMYTGYAAFNGPFVIRYPRGKGEMKDWRNEMQVLPIGKGKKLRDGDDIAVLSIGPIGNEVIKAIEMVKEEGVSIAHYDMIYLKPLDEELLHEIGRKYNRIITVENGVIKGGFGSAVLEFMADNGYTPHVKRIGVPDAFIEHGSIPELYQLCGMDAESIAKQLKKEN